jgi:hypothetical protein
MSRELDLLAREYQKTPVTVLRTELNLYQTSIQTAVASFLREVEKQCKKQKQSTVSIVAVIGTE